MRSADKNKVVFEPEWPKALKQDTPYRMNQIVNKHGSQNKMQKRGT